MNPLDKSSTFGNLITLIRSRVLHLHTSPPEIFQEVLLYTSAMDVLVVKGDLLARGVTSVSSSSPALHKSPRPQYIGR
jgi:sulfur transfer complex TusBCD TusB component (DsrH family)